MGAELPQRVVPTEEPPKPARAAGSIALRLILFAVLVTTGMLVLVGFVLSSLYGTSAERAFDRRIAVYLKNIVAEVATATVDELPEPTAFNDPLFHVPFSGWYWQVSRVDPRLQATRTSKSLSNKQLPKLAQSRPPSSSEGLRDAYVDGPEGQRLRVLERELDLGGDGEYLIAVAAHSKELEAEVASFNRALLATLAVLELAFLCIVFLQVRFGLKPLARMSQSLTAIREGRSERLDGKYPEEVEPIVGEVNALLDANREIVERARTHVGNLAHALKTPLSVLINEASDRKDPFAALVWDQAGIMLNQVTHHLDRARIAARASVLGSLCEMTPIITSLARTMEKIYHDKDLAIDVKVVDDLRFRGERQDVEEMVGNLIDNACKWASSRVEVEIFLAAPTSATGPRFFHVVVDDDGPGLSPAKRAEVGQRGRRLDESKAGSGLGLSIVHELAALYGGRFQLGTAPIGGLRAELVLPAA